MSVDLSALAAIKAKMKAAQERPSSVADEDLDALGIAPPEQPPNVASSAPSSLALMAKMKSLSARRRTVRNCGNCMRWKDCTILHRAGRVSPCLTACSGHQFTS